MLANSYHNIKYIPLACLVIAQFHSQMEIRIQASGNGYPTCNDAVMPVCMYVCTVL